MPGAFFLIFFFYGEGSKTPFSPHFPLREGKLQKQQPVGEISDKTALETHRFDCPEGTIYFLLQKMKKIKGKT